MMLKPNPLLVGVVGFAHFVVAFIVAIFAAGQADSLGRPHGRGWIWASNVLLFPLSTHWDALQRHFSFPEGFIVPCLLVHSLCWGVLISLLFSQRRQARR